MNIGLKGRTVGRELSGKNGKKGSEEMAGKSDYVLGEIIAQLHDLEEKIRELQRQTYADAWAEGEKEGRGCRRTESILSGSDDKIENEASANIKIDAKTAPKSPETHNLEDDCISLFGDEKEQKKANTSDFESVIGSEVLLHVQPRQLDEVDLPKIENIPMPAPTPAAPKTGKRMCPTCHGKIVTCIRQDGRKFECCERSRYNINIADRASRGDCKGWYQELDD
jgi:hypothetical protein